MPLQTRTQNNSSRKVEGIVDSEYAYIYMVLMIVQEVASL